MSVSQTQPTQPSKPHDVREDIKRIKRIANGVIHVSAAMKELGKGPLNEKCLVLLLSDATGLGKSTCEKVLRGLSDLEKLYLKQ